MEISAAVGFENVKVFAADPWWEAQPGSIKNLKIHVKGNYVISYYKGTGSGIAKNYRVGYRVPVRHCRVQTSVFED